MTAAVIKRRILEFASHVAFYYNGKTCGVDPYNVNSFSMWYGEKTVDAFSINEVMNTKIFGGKSLEEIAGEIDEIEG